MNAVARKNRTVAKKRRDAAITLLRHEPENVMCLQKKFTDHFSLSSINCELYTVQLSLKISAESV